MQHYNIAEHDTLVCAASSRFLKVITNIQTLLSGLTNNQGEEPQIQSALMEIDITSSSSGMDNAISIAPYIVVSDVILTSGNGGGITMDEVIDAFCTGDFEFSRLAPFQVLKNFGPIAGSTANVRYGGRLRLDLTKRLNRVVKKLLHSALLATNPFINLVLIGHNVTGTPSIFINSSIQVDYVVRSKPARII